MPEDTLLFGHAFRNSSRALSVDCSNRTRIPRSDSWNGLHRFANRYRVELITDDMGNSVSSFRHHQSTVSTSRASQRVRRCNQSLSSPMFRVRYCRLMSGLTQTRTLRFTAFPRTNCFREAGARSLDFNPPRLPTPLHINVIYHLRGAVSMAATLILARLTPSIVNSLFYFSFWIVILTSGISSKNCTTIGLKPSASIRICALPV